MTTVLSIIVYTKPSKIVIIVFLSFCNYDTVIYYRYDNITDITILHALQYIMHYNITCITIYYMHYNITDDKSGSTAGGKNKRSVASNKRNNNDDNDLDLR